jgi:hypothetical protein
MGKGLISRDVRLPIGSKLMMSTYIQRDIKDSPIYKKMGYRRANTFVRVTVLKIFIEELLKRLIFNHEEYVSPHSTFKMIMINRDTSSKIYKYDIKKRGKDPVLFFRINNRIWITLKQFFVVKLKGEAVEWVDEAMSKGVEYISLTKSGYGKFKIYKSPRSSSQASDRDTDKANLGNTDHRMVSGVGD